MERGAGGGEVGFALADDDGVEVEAVFVDQVEGG